MTHTPRGFGPRISPWHNVLFRFGSVGGILLVLASRGEGGESRDETPVPLAQDAPADAEEKPVLANVADGLQPSGAPADHEQEVRRAFHSGIVMLGGILICGVGLIAIVLLWGSRARRIARQKLPKISPRDELWYLKHKIESGAIRPRDRSDSNSPEDPQG